jgi:hypothetical protein
MADPGRIPLLGNLTSVESTIAAEFKAADVALDYFDILYYDSGWDCGTAADPNLRWCLDSALAFALNSTRVWAGLQRLHFFITFSNDVDRDTDDDLKHAFVGKAGDARWRSLVKTWTAAMHHPRYLKVNGWPVWQVLEPEIFVIQCGGNASLAAQRLAELRAAVVAQGLGPAAGPLLGGGDQSPMVPSGAALKPTPAAQPHPDGYMRYPQTDINLSGCTIATVVASSVRDCQAQCNATSGCRGVVIADSSLALLGGDSLDSGRGSSKSCQLKSDTAPGSNSHGP